MKVKISIEQEIDLDDTNVFIDDDPLYNTSDWTIDDKVDYLINGFAEDIDHMVKYDIVRDSVRVEYIEE